MRKKMFIITCASAALSIALWCFYYLKPCLTLAVVFSTVFYHVGIRLFVWTVLSLCKKKPFDFNNLWMREKKFEAKFYSFIRLNKWKNAFPSYLEDFDLTDGLLSAINTACLAEATHAIIIPLSFLPVIPMIIFYDASFIILFSILSVIAGVVDFLYVCVLRYNRFRFIKAYQQDNGRFKTLIFL